MLLKHISICLLITGLFSSVNSSAAGWGGEILFSPQFGGTDFDQTTGPTKHSRSWNFGNNWGFSAIVKAAYHGELLSVGVGGEVGWKTEAVEHDRNNVVGEYDYQMFRGYVGPYLTFGKIVHLYLGYDPLVLAKMTYTDNEHLNPFRVGDTLKGYAYMGGFGVGKDDGLFRILYRATIYTDIKTDGVEHKDLPDAEFSQLDTGELVFQFGVKF